MVQIRPRSAHFRDTFRTFPAADFGPPSGDPPIDLQRRPAEVAPKDWHASPKLCMAPVRHDYWRTSQAPTKRHAKKYGLITPTYCSRSEGAQRFTAPLGQCLINTWSSTGCACCGAEERPGQHETSKCCQRDEGLMWSGQGGNPQVGAFGFVGISHALPINTKTARKVGIRRRLNIAGAPQRGTVLTRDLLEI